MLTLFLSLVLAFTPFSPVPGPGDEVRDANPKAEQGAFALTNARIVTVTNGTIESGTVLIQGDSIAAVGADVSVPGEAQVIDCSGLTVYPGMIDSGTQLGLVEVGALSLTRDASEIGDLTPHMEALTAVNPSSVSIPVTRVNGITTVLAAPSGGLLPGTAALIDLHGYTPAQMLLGDVKAIILDFPTTGRRGSYDRRSQEEIDEAAQKALETLNETWDRAELYARIDSAYTAQPESNRKPEYVPEMTALLPAVRGERPIIVEANAAADITAALEWAEERGLTETMILSGAAEGWRVADEIAEANVPVLAGPVLAVPSRRSDRYDKAYVNPGLLQQAGVRVAIRTGETENVRNLPYHAGFAAAYGMDREEALRAVTIVPAQIFGVDDKVGSIEAGKQANLFVADGDPFETSTTIEHLFIGGYKIPMESRHTRLYDEFLDRNPGLEE